MKNKTEIDKILYVSKSDQIRDRPFNIFFLGGGGATVFFSKKILILKKKIMSYKDTK